MKETNIYEAPELEIIQLQQEEVIVTSGLSGTEPYVPAELPIGL